MITDAQLRSILERAAADFELPGNGPARIIARATTPETTSGLEPAAPRPRRAGRRRILLGGALAAAAVVVVAVVVNVVSTPDNSHPVTPIVAAGQARSTTIGVAHSGAAALPAPTRSFTSDGASSAKQAAPSTPAPSTPAPSTTGSGTPAKIASSGTLHLTVAGATLHDDVAALGTLAVHLGGYVSSTNVAENRKSSGGSIEIAVPATSFTTVIVGAERLGTTKSLITRSSDVTKTYSDTTAQITALEDVRAQLESLLTRAGKISDLLSVEQQIESTQSQIDVLESERSSLNEEVTYSTLVVDLAVTAPLVHKPAPPGALAKAWSKAISGFTGGLKWLLGISGAVLFSFILLVAVGLLGLLFVRRVVPRLRRYFL